MAGTRRDGRARRRPRPRAGCVWGGPVSRRDARRAPPPSPRPARVCARARARGARRGGGRGGGGGGRPSPRSQSPGRLLASWDRRSRRRRALA